MEVKLRNISSMGALVECPASGRARAWTVVIDIVGVGPVTGIVRWAQAGKFGVQFGEQFDLGRLAPKREKPQRRRNASAGIPRSPRGGR